MTGKDDSSEESASDEHEMGARRITVIAPAKMYEDLRAEAYEASKMLTELFRDIVREHYERVECDECGEMVPGDADWCPYCKAEVEEEEED